MIDNIQSIIVSKLICSLRKYDVSQEINYWLRKYDSKFRKYYLSKKVNYLLRTYDLHSTMVYFLRKLIICSENIMFPFAKKWTKKLIARFESMTLLIRRKQRGGCKKTILKAKMQRWRPLEATGGHGGQFPRTDLGTVS